MPRQITQTVYITGCNNCIDHFYSHLRDFHFCNHNSISSERNTIELYDKNKNEITESCPRFRESESDVR